MHLAGQSFCATGNNTHSGAHLVSARKATKHPDGSGLAWLGVFAMAGCCICYTTDTGYLFPTLVSAIQARGNTTLGKAEVGIFSFGTDRAAQAVFGDICRRENIRFHDVAPAMIDDAPAMLARLFLTRFVPEEFGHYLYIDGDTQIAGSLDPLVDAAVPAGKFLATDDPMVFAVPGTDSHSRGITEHFASIGLRDFNTSSYFNTGVLRINRDGWEAIGAEAWRLFRERAEASTFPDQDVLNLAGAGHRIPMSLAWNFPIFMLNSRVEGAIEPRIYHFMSNPKPWHGAFPPWDRAARTPYVEIVAKYPALAPYFTSMPVAKQVRYHLQQRYKKVLETFSWGLSVKRSRILDYERRLNGFAFER
jgi:lipopolysaccharide biosynthesis glycosyltransferase